MILTTIAHGRSKRPKKGNTATIRTMDIAAPIGSATHRRKMVARSHRQRIENASNAISAIAHDVGDGSLERIFA